VLKSAVQFLAVLVFVSLIGCGGKPQFLAVPSHQKVPEPAEFQLGRSPLLDITNHTTGHLDDNKNIYYYQTFGGGGVAVGLLLGPFGAAANASAIESQTEEDLLALNGKLAVDPVELFQASSSSITLRQDKSPTIAEISPYLYVTNVDEENLNFASTIIVDYNNLGINWAGKYMTQLDISLSKQEVVDGLTDEKLALLKSEMIKGFEQSLALYQKDKQHQLPGKNEVLFKSQFASPRFEFELMGEQVESSEERVNIRSFGVVYSLPKNSVELVKSTPIKASK